MARFAREGSPLDGWSKSRLNALKGRTEPRVFTPPLRELNRQTTLGYDVVDFATEVLGETLIPWQQWLLIHALELNDPWTLDTIHERTPSDQIFRFKKVVVLVARQNGKTTLGTVLALYAMYALNVPEILGVAQDLDVAEEVLQSVQDTIDDIPELAEGSLGMVKQAGKKAVRLNKEFGGSRYKVKAASRRAGRGLTGDLIFFDELREQQTWDAWGAITKTTDARASALVWCMSNAGDNASAVLKYLRLKAHEALGDPDGVLKAMEAEDLDSLLPAASDEDMDLDDLAKLNEQGDDGDQEKLIASSDDLAEDMDMVGFFEWSIPPSWDYRDPEGWPYANPSVGYTGLTGQTLAHNALNDPEPIFRTENGCQWVESLMQGPFPEGAWEAGWWDADENPGLDLPQIQGPAKACVDVPLNRSRAYITVGGTNEHGRIQIELATARAGLEWVCDWLEDMVDRGIVNEITGQTRGAPVAAVLEEAKHRGLPVTDWQGPDLSNGTARFYDAVVNNLLDHFKQPAVDMAAQRAKIKHTADGAMLIDRVNSPVDAAPLVGFAGTHWLLTRPEETRESDFDEDEGLLIL